MILLVKREGPQIQFRLRAGVGRLGGSRALADRVGRWLICGEPPLPARALLSAVGERGLLASHTLHGRVIAAITEGSCEKLTAFLARLPLETDAHSGLTDRDHGMWPPALLTPSPPAFHVLKSE